jgi:hypothetical protein
MLNKKAVKAQILMVSKDIHGDLFTRISPDVYFDLTLGLSKLIQEFVRNHPKKGKTLKPYAPEPRAD